MNLYVVTHPTGGFSGVQTIKGFSLSFVGGTYTGPVPQNVVNELQRIGYTVVAAPSKDYSDSLDASVATLVSEAAPQTSAALKAAYVTPWAATWRTAWAAAKAGTGVAQLAIDGDSVTAGQAGGTQTDGLVYGFVGRLEALLAASANVQAVGYTIAGVNPGGLTAPSGPYSGVVVGANTQYDGGVGALWVPPNNAGSSTDVVIALPKHRLSGANPTSVDVFTVDYAPGTTWAWNLDGGSPTTVSVTGGTNNTTGGQLRRTTITLDGVGAHTLNLGVQSAGNALMFVGHQVRYGTAGLSLFRNGIQGWRGIDFAVGGGNTAGLGGRASIGPDHIAPWSGVNNTYNAAGPGAPFGAHLTVITSGLNDCSYGSRKDAYEKYLTRRVQAARRGQPGASVLLVDMAYPSIYSDNPSLGRPYNYEGYKAIKRQVADTHGCGYLDIGPVFGSTPVASGYMASGDIHPTSNGAGAGGGDGHLLIAQSIASLIA